MQSNKNRFIRALFSDFFAFEEEGTIIRRNVKDTISTPALALQ
jgi:hypothetical protein